MIPVLNVVRRWSPFASASGSVALSWTVLIAVTLFCYVFKWYYICIYCMFLLYPCGWASALKSLDWCYPLCALVTLVLRLIRFYNPCRLGTEMVALVRVIRLVHILLPVPYTPRVALYIHVSATSIAWMVWHCVWVSAHKSSDWCYPLCALVTLVLRLFGFYYSCLLGMELVALVRVIRLVHILLPVPYTLRVARVR